MGQALSASEYEKKQQKIASRRLRKCSRQVNLRSHEWETAEQLRPGDVIARSIAPGPTWHYGIYLGDGKVCDQALNAPPAEICIGEFLGGMDYFQVIPYDNDSPEARADTVEIARMSIGHEEWTVPGYSPLTNNCEHFATFCKTGQKSSTQADTARTFLSGLLAFAGYSSVLVLAPNDYNDP